MSDKDAISISQYRTRPNRVHFGLGKETQVEKLQVEFAEPDTKKVVIDSPEINQLLNCFTNSKE